jgi:hypothetical protein
MQRIFLIAFWTLTLAAATELAGCVSAHPAASAPPVAIQVRTVHSDSVVIQPPSVVRSGDNLIVSGAVTRKPGVNADMAGRVRIICQSASGKIVHEMLIALSPQSIPVAGDRQSKYELQSSWLPPGDVTLVAEFTPITSEDLVIARATSGGGYASNHAIGGSVSSGPSVGSGHHGGVGHGR